MSVIPSTPRTLLDCLARDGALADAKWVEFDRMYRPVVRFFIRQRFSSLVDDAEDIAQDAMVKLVAQFRARTYDPARAKFRTYLAAIVYNIAVDYLRRQRRDRALDIAQLDWMGASPPPGSAVMERQWKEACYEAARKHVLEQVLLPDGYREIYLDAEKGAKSSDVAQRHKVKPSLVRQVKHRVGAMIGDYLKLLL